MNMFKRNRETEPPPKLPKGILKEGNFYRIEGCISRHIELEQALKQQGGIKDAR